MGQARDVMDRLTNAMMAKDREALAACYSTDVVGVTPEEGTISGRDAVCKYLLEFLEAFPDFTYEYLQRHESESGNVAIDEGYFGGTNTGPLTMPSGERVPATGRRARVRSCDVAVVEDGQITAHRFYSDQVDLLGQLGLLPDTTA